MMKWRRALQEYQVSYKQLSLQLLAVNLIDPVMYQHSTTVDAHEDMKKCVESADTMKYPKDAATQFNYLIPLRGK